MVQAHDLLSLRLEFRVVWNRAIDEVMKRFVRLTGRLILKEYVEDVRMWLSRLVEASRVRYPLLILKRENPSAPTILDDLRVIDYAFTLTPLYLAIVYGNTLVNYAVIQSTSFEVNNAKIVFFKKDEHENVSSKEISLLAYVRGPADSVFSLLDNISRNCERVIIYPEVYITNIY